MTEEEQKRFLQYSFKTGTVLAVIGICIVVFGSINRAPTVKYAGLIVSLGGMISMGNRLWERIREKRKLKAFIEKNS